MHRIFFLKFLDVMEELFGKKEVRLKKKGLALNGPGLLFRNQ